MESLGTVGSAMQEQGPTVVLFTCNWNAYGSLEAAGNEGRSYSAAIRPVRVMCLGRLDTGIVIKALEKGADGVLLLGCTPEECHFQFGSRHAEEAFERARETAALLGLGPERVGLVHLAAGHAEGLVQAVERFVAGLNGNVEP